MQMTMTAAKEMTKRTGNVMPQTEGLTAKALETMAAFDMADKMLAGAAERAGFKSEEELLSYVKSVRQCRCY